MSDDIVARLRVWSVWLDERVRDTDAPNDLREAADEIERLRKGGCARDQTTTQFCAEAVRLQRELDELKRIMGACCVHGGAGSHTAGPADPFIPEAL